MNTKAFVILFCLLFLIILVGLGALFQKKIASNPESAQPEAENELSLVGTEEEQMPDNVQGIINSDDPNQQNIQNQQQNQAMQPPKDDHTKMVIDTNKNYSAVLETTEGNITVAFTTKATPKTVNNFISLAKKDFYDNTIFHRVIKGFMIQGGDPRGDGTGGPGYKFDDEPFDGEYSRGTVAMANSGPNTNGSQFFIMHEENPLPKNYVIFGHVTEGLDVVDKIAEAEVTMSRSGERSKPVDPVKITNVKVVEE